VEVPAGTGCGAVDGGRVRVTAGASTATGTKGGIMDLQAGESTRPD
jgi:hypothetical protein